MRKYQRGWTRSYAVNQCLINFHFLKTLGTFIILCKVMVLQGNLKSKYIWKDKDINVGSGGYLGPPVGRGGPPAIPHGSVVLKPPSIMPDGLTGFIMVSFIII